MNVLAATISLLLAQSATANGWNTTDDDWSYSNYTDSPTYVDTPAPSPGDDDWETYSPTVLDVYRNIDDNDTSSPTEDYTPSPTVITSSPTEQDWTESPTEGDWTESPTQAEYTDSPTEGDDYTPAPYVEYTDSPTEDDYTYSPTEPTDVEYYTASPTESRDDDGVNRSTEASDTALENAVMIAAVETLGSSAAVRGASTLALGVAYAMYYLF